MRILYIPDHNISEKRVSYYIRDNIYIFFKFDNRSI